MNFALGMLLAVVLLKPTAPTLTAGKCPFLKDILESRGFRDLVLGATKASYLGIFLHPDFGVEEHRLLTEFLKVLPASPRIFNCYNCATTKVRYVALRFFCRTIYKQDEMWEAFPYWTTLGVFTVNITETFVMKKYSHVGEEDLLEGLRRGAEFIVVVRDEKISVIGNYENRCLNCTSYDRRGFPLTLIRDLPIRGKNISLACLWPQICESPAFLAFTESLLYANCSLEIFLDLGLLTPFISRATSLVDPGYIFYVPIDFYHDEMFPTVSTPFYCDRAEIAVFVKALKPLPKEATLFIPFSPFVWAVFLVCFVLSLLTSYLLSRFGRSVPGFQAIAAAFAASLVQQGYPVSPHAQNIQSFRIIFGVWCLTVMILATGYKGVVTSLFCNVPMNGELKKLTSFRDALTHVPLPCLVNFPHRDFMRARLLFKEGPDAYMYNTSLSCMDTLGRVRDEANNEFVLLHSPSSKDGENRNDELLRIGFVKSDAHLSTILAGPQMRSSSPYYKHVRKLISRAFEAGLFERAERISNYKRRVQREFRYGKPSKNEEEPLTLSNLQPCFVIWAFGIGVSLLVFVVLRVVSFCIPSRCRRARRTINQA